MAFQKGIVKINGAVDDIVFVETKHGYVVRKKRGATKDRIKTDPKFARTRENGLEFGRACKDGKLLRKALRVLINQSKDPDVTSRMVAEMMKVIKADPVSRRGARNAMDGNTKFLEGFDFNIHAPLERTLKVDYTVNVNRVTGDIAVDIPAFDPRVCLATPPGATHCRIVTGAALVDFARKTHSTGTARSLAIDLNGVDPVSFHESNLVTANGTAPIFVAIGVEFYGVTNGVEYAILDTSFNALSIVLVDGGPRANGGRINP